MPTNCAGRLAISNANSCNVPNGRCHSGEVALGAVDDNPVVDSRAVSIPAGDSRVALFLEDAALDDCPLMEAEHPEVSRSAVGLQEDAKREAYYQVDELQVA